MSDTPDKPSLRAALRERLGAIGADRRAPLSAAACAHALAWPPLARARAALLFAPVPSEIDVEPLTRALLAQGVRVCLPRVHWESRTIEPVPVRDPAADLEPDSRGLRQPTSSLPAIDRSELQAIVTPGLAFDLRGGRLGRAGGFYDRFLADAPASIATIGVCFDEQIVALVPMEPHDVRVHALATPTRLVQCAQVNG